MQQVMARTHISAFIIYAPAAWLATQLNCYQNTAEIPGDLYIPGDFYTMRRKPLLIARQNLAILPLSYRVKLRKRNFLPI